MADCYIGDPIPEERAWWWRPYPWWQVPYAPTVSGWICPRCNVVNAPHVSQCACAITITTNKKD